MKVDVISVNDVEKRMTVCISADLVDSEIDNTYNGLKKRLKSRGLGPEKFLLRYSRSILKRRLKRTLFKRSSVIPIQRLWTKQRKGLFLSLKSRMALLNRVRTLLIQPF